MEKISVGNNVFIYPMPVTLVGTMVNGKPNFMAAGWINRVNANPPMLGIGIHRPHYTTGGILENKTFSVCFPSSKMVEKTDYCGLVSGKKVDKSELFDVFYGNLNTAPMIAECPLCLECRLVQTVELPTNNWFIGEIVESYTEANYLSDGKLDVTKMDPMVLTMPDNGYWKVGQQVGKAWSAGKKLKKEA